MIKKGGLPCSWKSWILVPPHFLWCSRHSKRVRILRHARVQQKRGHATVYNALVPKITNYKPKRQNRRRKSGFRADPTEPTYYPNLTHNYSDREIEIWTRTTTLRRKRDSRVKFIFFVRNHKLRNSFFCELVIWWVQRKNLKGWLQRKLNVFDHQIKQKLATASLRCRSTRNDI